MITAVSRTRSYDLRSILRRVPPAALLMTLILCALLFFEIFNFSTTDYALSDLLGSITFAGIQWSTILAIAFCSIDFAGIARLFITDANRHEPKETWYLLGAWMLAATMNASLTWWGVSMAIVNHSVLSTTVVSANTLVRVVPVFVAIMVWVIRILIIGSLSYAVDRAFQVERRPSNGGMVRPHPQTMPINTATRPMAASAHTPTRRPVPVAQVRNISRPEPTYHSLHATSNRNETVAIQEPSASETRQM